MSADVENRTDFLKKVLDAEGGLVAAVYDRRGGRNGKSRRSQSAATNWKLFLDADGRGGKTEVTSLFRATQFVSLGATKGPDHERQTVYDGR